MSYLLGCTKYRKTEIEGKEERKKDEGIGEWMKERTKEKQFTFLQKQDIKSYVDTTGCAYSKEWRLSNFNSKFVY